MNRIEIRGVIVSADYDNEWWTQEIDNGLITPESRIRSALAKADPARPLELYINSVGGSVFAGYEMLNSLSEWSTRTGQPVNVTVGSMVASAAATIVVMLGPVTAHENVEFMFHSAASWAEGGPETMRDTADLLDQINRKVVVALVGKYGADLATVTEWFSEGRMGWLDLEGAIAIGLVDKVIPAAGEVISFAGIDFEKMRDGQKVAALIDPKHKESAMNWLQKLAQMLGITKEKPEESDVEQKIEELKQNTDAAYDEGKQAGRIEGAKEAAEAGLQEIATAKAEAEAAKAENESIKQQLAEATKAKNEAEAKVKALAPAFSAGDGSDDPTGAAGNFLDIVDEKVKAGASMDAALLSAQREFPELHAQFCKKK